jgi:hypothetical protein
MLRVNTAYGTATVISEEVSTSGKAVVRVVLDSNGEERIFLRDFVTESDTPVPLIAKAKPARKSRRKKTEDISDDLLVDTTPKIGIQLDAVDVDELPEELKNAADLSAEEIAE